MPWPTPGRTRPHPLNTPAASRLCHSRRGRPSACKRGGMCHGDDANSKEAFRKKFDLSDCPGPDEQAPDRHLGWSRFGWPMTKKTTFKAGHFRTFVLAPGHCQNVRMSEGVQRASRGKTVKNALKTPEITPDIRTFPDICPKMSVVLHLDILPLSLREGRNVQRTISWLER